jgi:hypothetical protein
VWWRELQAQARAATMQEGDRKARIDPSASIAETARLDTSKGPIFVGARRGYAMAPTSTGRPQSARTA